MTEFFVKTKTGFCKVAIESQSFTENPPDGHPSATVRFSLNGSQTEEYTARYDNTACYYDTRETLPPCLALAFRLVAQFLKDHTVTGEFLDFIILTRADSVQLVNHADQRLWSMEPSDRHIIDMQDLPAAPDSFENALVLCLSATTAYFIKTDKNESSRLRTSGMGKEKESFFLCPTC